MSEGIEASFLAIIFENSDELWSALEQSSQLTPNAFIEHLLIFIRAHALLNDANQLAVFSISRGTTTLLHATPGCLPTRTTQRLAPPGSPHQSHIASLDSAAALLENLKQQQKQPPPSPTSLLPLPWSGALLRTLCFINKFNSTTASSPSPSPSPPLKSRILCLSSAPDDPGQYLAVMNAIFAAQRHHVIIDACVLGKRDSSFMQQASYLTGGTYMKPGTRDALLQYLLTAYSVDPGSRAFLQLPLPTGVDFRASCFCHKRPTSLGYVCSVCLSIFCEQVPACSTCGTTFSATTPSS